MDQAAYRYQAQVGPAGKLELQVPLAPGTPVEIVVLPPAADDFSDLVEAAQTSLAFWDNAQDDADWNDA